MLENNVAVYPWPIHFCLRLKRKNGLTSEAGPCYTVRRKKKDIITWGKKASLVNVQCKTSCMEDDCPYGGTSFTVEMSLQYWEKGIKNGVTFFVLLSLSFHLSVGNVFKSYWSLAIKVRDLLGI